MIEHMAINGFLAAVAALARDLGLGFTSNGGDNSVTIFDLATLQTKAKIPISGRNPDAIVYESKTKRVYVFDDASEDAIVLDARAGTVMKKLTLPGFPRYAVTDGSGMLYDVIEDKSEIVTIDASTNAIVRTWPLGACVRPSDLAIDTANHVLFASCANDLMSVVDTQSGAVLTTIPIGAGSNGVAFDPATQLIFSANGKDGTVTIAHEDTPSAYTVTQTVPAHGMAIERKISAGFQERNVDARDHRRQLQTRGTVATRASRQALQVRTRVTPHYAPLRSR